MPFNEDLSAFFADFADQAQLGGQPVRGIFDNGYALAAGGVVGLASTQPAFTLATSSVGPDVVGQTLVVGSTSYVVAEHQPDGTGVSLLLLERAL